MSTTEKLVAKIKSLKARLVVAEAALERSERVISRARNELGKTLADDFRLWSCPANAPLRSVVYPVWKQLCAPLTSSQEPQT